MQDYVRNNFDEFVFKTPNKVVKRLRALSVTPVSNHCIIAAIEFCIISVITIFAAELNKYHLYASINIVIFLHVFFHLALSIHYKRLLPGVITGLSLIIPYELKVMMFLFINGSVNVGLVLLYLCLIAIIYPPFHNIIYIWGSVKK